MLEHLGEHEAAARVEGAVCAVIGKGLTTPDLVGEIAHRVARQTNVDTVMEAETDIYIPTIGRVDTGR